MWNRRFIGWTLISLLAGLGLAGVTSFPAAKDAAKAPPVGGHAGQAHRDFLFKYQVTITDIPPGTKLARIWVPVPEEESCQKITDLQIQLPGKEKAAVDPVYDNRLAYVEVENPPAQLPIELSFQCQRYEDCPDLTTFTSGGELTAAEKLAYAVYLEPHQLVIIDDRIRDLAAKTTAGKNTTVEKARAIYDYVLEHMTYDKTGTGWGRGDTNYACDVGKGNCTDFHSLFLSMARASGIPATFEIGFPLPEDKTEGPIGGYHCWAKFYVSGKGWVPVDISEADKRPEKAEYFFGHLCPNRVNFTVGRDLRPEPGPASAPLNFLIYPLVEVDGQVHTSMEKAFSFQNVGT